MENKLQLCTVLKAFKYRIEPTNEQAALINKHIGCTRFLYNLALECKQIAYASAQVNLSRYDLQKQLVDLKAECKWLKDVNSQSLQVALMNLDAAYLNFFKGRASFPKFKSKQRGSQSFNVPQSIKLKEGKLVIPKFKDGIEIILHRPIKGEIRQATISRTPTGKYFASILCDTGEECNPKKKITEKKTVGIDLGLKTFIVSSDGQEFDNPNFLRKAQSKLKYTQRKYSKHKGKRTRQKLAILHEKVANQRKDFLHKVSTRLIKNHDSIAIENLQVANMLKNHKLALSIQDAGWGMFVNFLKYKAEWYGNNILEIGTFEPSSQIHNICGYQNKDLTLSDRKWTCPKCGEIVLRDVNAAINIKNFAIKNHLSGEHRLKNQGKLPTLVGALILEAQSPLGIW